MIAPLILKENLPEKYANFFGTIFYMFLTGGILIANTLYFDTAIENWYLVFNFN